MLYIGNFNYNDDNAEHDNYCLMPAIVEATDADEALDKFQAMFERIHAGSDLIDGAHKVYLDSLIELDQAPEQAVLLQWQKIVPVDDGLCSITAALPELEGEGAAYSWSDGSDDDADDGDDADLEDLDWTDEDLDGDDYYEEEPFLSL